MIGLFVGFILAAMAFSIVFFRHVPAAGQGPGLGFLVLPLLLVGFTLVAAVGPESAHVCRYVTSHQGRWKTQRGERPGSGRRPCVPPRSVRSVGSSSGS